MKILTTAFAIVLLSSCANSGSEKATDAKKDTTLVASSTDKTDAPIPDSVMQKNWMAYMTPGAEHKMLADMCGTWTAEVSTWMKPDAPPEKSTGVFVNKMIMGGLYQQSEFKGSYMGKPFNGLSLLGFDNGKKMFVSTWIDNMGSGIMKMEGNWDEATKSISFHGRCTDPATNKETDLREEFKLLDNDRQLMETYGKGPDGKEMKMMSILYTRKK